MSRTIPSDAYDRVQYSHQGKYGLELLDKLSVSHGARVLDLGCGTGYLTSILADRVGPEGKVTGVDPSRERIDVAERKYAEYRNLEFFDKGSDDFPVGPYDIVFSNFVLHWIEDKETAFQRVQENLNPGGYFAFLCPAKPAKSIWEQLNPKIDKQHHFASSDEYLSLAQRHGFEVEFKSVDSVRHVFDSVDVYMEWMQASVNVHAHDIDPKVMTEIKKRFQAQPHMDWTRIVYILKKVP
jgi:trans-aconitate methyltransferase